MPSHSTPHVPSGAKGVFPDRQDVQTPSFLWRGVLAALQLPCFDIDLFTDVRTRANVDSLANITWPGACASVEPWQGQPRDGFDVYSAWGNPQFDSLPWVLERAARMRWDASTRCELTLLVPLRPHRVYWRFAHSSDLEVHLPAFCFEGEDNTFALPCCLLHWGPRAQSIIEGLESIVVPGTRGRRPVVVRRRALTRFGRGVIVAPVLTQQSLTALDGAVRIIQQALGSMSRSGSTKDSWWRPDEHQTTQGFMVRFPGARKHLRTLMTAEDKAGYAATRAQDHLEWATQSIDHSIAWVLYYVDIHGLRGFRRSGSLIETLDGNVDGEVLRILKEAKKSDAAAAKKKKSAAAKKVAAAAKSAKAKSARRAKPKGSKGPKTPPKGPKTPPKKPSAKRTAHKGGIIEVAEKGSDPDVDPRQGNLIDVDAVEKPAANGDHAAPDPVAAPEAVERFVASKAIGDEWSIGDIIPSTTSSRSSVARELKKRPDTKAVGKGRGAKWKKVS